VITTTIIICDVVVGSPFHPAVVNPGRVQLLGGGWDAVLEPHSKSLRLPLHEPFSLEFDTRHAGPGKHISSSPAVLIGRNTGLACPSVRLSVCAVRATGF